MSELSDEQVSYILEKEEELKEQEQPEEIKEFKDNEKKPSKLKKLFVLLGFIITLVGFGLVVLGALYSFLPTMQTTFKTLEILFGIGAGLIIVGIIICGIGQDSLRLLARFTYFLATIGIIAAAAMLVIIICFQKIVPLPAWERLYSDSADIFKNLI